MKLQQLFSLYDINFDASKVKSQAEISGLFFDSRAVVPNSVFIAIKGIQNNGHQFINEAIQGGAIALVVETKSNVPLDFLGEVLEVSDSRQALHQLAAIFYDYPSQELFCFGVTGTNGKTSITYLLEHILNFNNKPTAVMGTVNHRILNQKWESQITTPDPITLQKRLREFVDHQAMTVAMEVSSHALDQKRADSVGFNTVIFTNLTLDHLDYHRSMRGYFEAKQKLFTDLMWASPKKPLFAVVNTDDSYGKKLLIADHVIVWTYGQKESDFQFKILAMDYNQTEFELKTPMETTRIQIPLSGVHMIYNCVASLVAALTCGISLEQAVRALKNFQGVPGRLQRVASASNKTVFVDYAHTPDALENVLKSLHDVRRKINLKSKIITVFGCGGDRDKSKRPVMAAIAAKYSDSVFITSDNPRTELPELILADVQKGIPSHFQNLTLEVDREKAIAAAIRSAHHEDVILIAGKGHEEYQIIGTEKIHFSDIEVAQKYL